MCARWQPMGFARRQVVWLQISTAKWAVEWAWALCCTATGLSLWSYKTALSLEKLSAKFTPNIALLFNVTANGSTLACSWFPRLLWCPSSSGSSTPEKDDTVFTPSNPWPMIITPNPKRIRKNDHGHALPLIENRLRLWISYCGIFILLMSGAEHYRCLIALLGLVLEKN